MQLLDIIDHFTTTPIADARRELAALTAIVKGREDGRSSRGPAKRKRRTATAESPPAGTASTSEAPPF